MRQRAELPVRQSHKNPAIQKIYETYLGEPCGELSHKLLHRVLQPAGSVAIDYVIDLPKSQSAPYGSKSLSPISLNAS
ncbi:MAG: iron hydrogenase small subunit [Clostridium fessum]